MNIKIVSDSSSNIYDVEGVDFKSVPLKIISESREYVDTPDLDVKSMVEDMYESKERFSTSCPNAFDWGEAFKGGENIFAVTITKHLSGCYSAALNSAEDFKAENPQANIYVIDSLSTGGEMQLIIEKLKELAEKGLTFEEIKDEIEDYQKHTHLIFALRNLNNLAKNGRVNPAVAKIAGVLGIRIIGKADDGHLKTVHKCKGKAKTLETLKNDMLEMGFKGGKVRISHCLNEESANELKDKILTVYPESDIEILPCTGLCSFYAELGGLLVGFED
ncbi:MAG: DegV family protein [Clostridia bacterium]|nr:DegV family protein [Clostridia bacterium]